MLHFILASYLFGFLTELLDRRLQLHLHVLKLIMGICYSISLRHYRHEVALRRV